MSELLKIYSITFNSPFRVRIYKLKITINLKELKNSHHNDRVKQVTLKTLPNAHLLICAERKNVATRAGKTHNATVVRFDTACNKERHY